MSSMNRRQKRQKTDDDDNDDVYSSSSSLNDDDDADEQEIERQTRLPPITKTKMRHSNSIKNQNTASARRTLRAKRREKASRLFVKIEREFENEWQTVRRCVTDEFQGEKDYESCIESLQTMETALAKLRRLLPDLHMEKLRAKADVVFGDSTLSSSQHQQRTAAHENLGRASIIYCDPPWQYNNTVHTSATTPHYATMSDNALAALPVAGLASEDCVLLMWATFPKLHDALRLMESWGFEYKTVFMVWVKVQRYLGRLAASSGAYTRPNAELVLIGMRGNISPSIHTAFHRCNVLLARSHEHSRKPAIMRQIAVELFGDYPRIELFAREQHLLDWSAWGDQLERFGKPPTATPAKKRKQQPSPATFQTLERIDEHNSMQVNDFVFVSDANNERDWSTLRVRLDKCRVRRLDEYFARSARDNRRRRHQTYTALTEHDVAANIDTIHACQQTNADQLFARNYIQ